MDSVNNITIEKIFFLQEKCFKHMLPLVEERFSFIKECIELLINRHIDEECLTEEDQINIDITHSFLGNTVSNLIVCIKLSLYGACVESLSLLRVSVETMTIMAWKIEKGNFSEDVSFNKARQQIKAKDDIKELYDYLSDKFVHLNNRTEKFQRFNINGKLYPRIGMAIDKDGTNIVLGILLRAALYLVRILTDFYNSKSEIVGKNYFIKVGDLEQKYALLQRKARS